MSFLLPIQSIIAGKSAIRLFYFPYTENNTSNNHTASGTNTTGKIQSIHIQLIRIQQNTIATDLKNQTAYFQIQTKTIQAIRIQLNPTGKNPIRCNNYEKPNAVYQKNQTRENQIQRKTIQYFRIQMKPFEKPTSNYRNTYESLRRKFQIQRKTTRTGLLKTSTKIQYPDCVSVQRCNPVYTEIRTGELLSTLKKTMLISIELFRRRFLNAGENNFSTAV